jgi:hypothetical protein
MTNNRSIRNISVQYGNTTPPYTLAYLESYEEYHDFMQIAGQNLGFLDQSSIARITGFYTSLKILRDRLRMLKNRAIDASSEKPSNASKAAEFWKNTLRQTMYDFFLCLENARIALHLLLEGDDLHDDSIFICLMSEIRAFVFLRGLNDNGAYISERLDARLRPPVFGTHEELESYLHPAYAVAVRKMCTSYEQFYEDNIGKEIIEKLRVTTATNTTAGPSRLAVQTVRSLGIGILAILTIGLCRPCLAEAEQANACSADSAPGILAAIRDSKNIPRIQGVPSFDIAPIAGPMSLALRRTFGADKIDDYRVVVQFGHDLVPTGPRTALAEGTQISAIEIPETNTMRTSNLVAPHDTLLSLITPVPPAANRLRINGWGWGWQGGMITVVGCAAKQVVFIAPFQEVTFSDRATCIVVTVLTVVLVYLLVSKGVHTWDNRLRAPSFKVKFGRYLDPVMLSSGPNGKGSISRLQILFFSTLLFALLLYILIRVGLLSDMSTTVLLLLGISGIGAAASKATDVGLNRLDFNNWAWMIGKGWLPPNGLASVTTASWRDIITADDGFDVYHFQMLIFSLVVGVALLQVGFTDLSAFTIPAALLAVLGLSQAVYVGGKLVASPASGDLNKSVTELRARETAFVEAALRSVPPDGSPSSSPKDLAEAIKRARREYSAYIEQQELVKPMFKSVLGDFQPGASFEPRYT